MDKRNTKLKKNITQMIGQLSNIYKEVSQKENSAYLTGKKEAYEEMLNWLISSHNPDLRYISANSFLNMAQEKINKTKIQINNLGDEQEDEQINLKDLKDLKQINFLDLKINDNKKRFNRFAQGQSQNLTGFNSPIEGDERKNNSTNDKQFTFFNPFITPSGLTSNNNMQNKEGNSSIFSGNNNDIFINTNLQENNGNSNDVNNNIGNDINILINTLGVNGNVSNNNANSCFLNNNSNRSNRNKNNIFNRSSSNSNSSSLSKRIRK